MSRPPHTPWFNRPNRIRWRIQAVRFFNMRREDKRFWTGY
jgi:hypothetical protein